MKIALIIFRIGPSHGSILQTYALTRTLESLGHQVTIIDRHKPVFIRDFKVCTLRVLKHIKERHFSWYDFYVGEYSKVIMKELNPFIEKELRKQTVSFSSEKILKVIGEENFDAFIVGSDQTWRPKYVYDIYNYYLDFVPKSRKVKRISYASSFGTSEWEYSKEQTKKCQALLQRFDGISVREEDGVLLCKKYFNADAIHVLDPTLLLLSKDYLYFTKTVNTAKYVGCNYLDIRKEKLEYAEEVSKILNVPVKQLITMGDDRKKAEDRIAPSIETWLTGIKEADFMIVDSFHATVFCILFHKPFLTIGNYERGLSRFGSLLRMAGLESRLIKIGDLISEEIIKMPINWESVDSRLMKEREKSLNFLKNSLA